MFTFDENKAKSADSSAHITEGGYYPNATIKAAVVLKGNEQSQYIKFEVEQEGRDCNFNIYLKKKSDGSVTYGVNKIYALMGILGVQKTSSLPVTVDNFGRQEQGNSIPEFIGKVVGLRLMREDYRKQDGTIGFSMNLLNFIGNDGKTYSERVDNKPAKTIETAIKDKRLQAPQHGAAAPMIPNQTTPMPTDDDMPF